MPDAAIGRNIFQCLASGFHGCQKKREKEMAIHYQSDCFCNIIFFIFFKMSNVLYCSKG